MRQSRALGPVAKQVTAVFSVMAGGRDSGLEGCVTCQLRVVRVRSHVVAPAVEVLTESWMVMTLTALEAIYCVFPWRVSSPHFPTHPDYLHLAANRSLLSGEQLLINTWKLSR